MTIEQLEQTYYSQYQFFRRIRLILMDIKTYTPRSQTLEQTFINHLTPILIPAPTIVVPTNFNEILLKQTKDELRQLWLKEKYP